MKTREAFFLHNPIKFVTYRSEMIKVFRDFKETGNVPATATITPDQFDFALLRENLFRIIASYSLGYFKPDLKLALITDFGKQLQTWRNSVHYRKLSPADPTQYHLMVWAISLAILLDLDDTIWNEFVEALEPREPDQLISILVAKRNGQEPDFSGPIQQPHLYKSLLSGIQARATEQNRLITSFLEGYYNNLQGTAWFEKHLDQDPQFFGYWSFELAAAVKLWGISDVTFANNMFYPRDLVHDRLFRTWEDSEAGEQARQDYQAFKEKAAQDELADMKSLLTDFAKSALKTGTENLDEEGEAKLKQAEENFGKLASMLGLDMNTLAGQDKEANRQSLLDLFAGIANITEAAANAKPGDGNLPFEGMQIDADLEKELEELMEKLPRNVRRQLQDPGTADEIRAQMRKQMADVTRALRELSSSEEMSAEELSQALHKLAKDFGIKVDPNINKPGEIKARAKQKAAEKLKTLREGRKPLDLDFDKIWNED